jgi:hypothetical protein
MQESWKVCGHTELEKGERAFIPSTVPRNSVTLKRKAAGFFETTEKTYFSAVYGNPADCNFILINLLHTTECPNCLNRYFRPRRYGVFPSEKSDCLFVRFHRLPRQTTNVLQPSWLFVPPALDVPTLATRRPRTYRRVPHSSGESWNFWKGNKYR